MALAKIKIYNDPILKPQHVQYFQHYDHRYRHCVCWFGTRKLKTHEFDCFIPMEGIVSEDPRLQQLSYIEKANRKFYSVKSFFLLFPELETDMRPLWEYFYYITRLFRIHKPAWRQRMMARYTRKMNGEPLRSPNIR
jgi:hypothetical protein